MGIDCNRLNLMDFSSFWLCAHTKREVSIDACDHLGGVKADHRIGAVRPWHTIYDKRSHAGARRGDWTIEETSAYQCQVRLEVTISADSLVLHTAVQGGIMKKIAVAGLIALLSIVSVSASACPKGTHPTGGTGSHHKGGTCK